MEILCVLVSIYLVVLVVRAILSWFPLRPGTPFAGVFSIAFDLTEPVIAPLRRVIPPAGPLDLSFLVLFFILIILRGAFC